eukprot:31188-Pelagococcus_subviridis.AAC.5
MTFGDFTLHASGYRKNDTGNPSASGASVARSLSDNPASSGPLSTSRAYAAAKSRHSRAHPPSKGEEKSSHVARSVAFALAPRSSIF